MDVQQVMSAELEVESILFYSGWFVEKSWKWYITSYVVTLLLLHRTSIREKVCERREILRQSHSMTIDRIRQEEQDKQQKLHEFQSLVRAHFRIKPISLYNCSKKNKLSKMRSKPNESKSKTLLRVCKRLNDLSEVISIHSLFLLTFFRIGGGNRRGVLKYCRPGARKWNHEETTCRIWFLSLFRSQTQFFIIIWYHSFENGNS